VYQIKEEGIKNDIKETHELLRQQDIKNLEERLVRGGIIYWQMTLSEQSMIGRLTWTVSKRVNLHRKSHVRTFIAAEHPSPPRCELTRPDCRNPLRCSFRFNHVALQCGRPVSTSHRFTRPREC
jgi:hypothetical protein